MFAVFKIPYRDPYRFIPPTASQKAPRGARTKKWWRHMPVERWDLGETALHDLCCLEVFQTPTTCEISFMRWVIFIHQWKRWCWPNGGQGCLGSTARCKKNLCSAVLRVVCFAVWCFVWDTLPQHISHRSNWLFRLTYMQTLLTLQVQLRKLSANIIYLIADAHEAMKK